MNNDIVLQVSTAIALGLGSSAHCMGMCGGIACALGLQDHKRPKLAIALYNTGRIVAYAAIALLLGSLLQQLQTRIPALTLWLRTGASLLLIAMALHTLQLWRGILLLEKIGARLWNPLQKTGKRLLPARHYWQILLLGFLWGWLPCALVYSTLSWSVTQGSAMHAAILMMAFGTGTTPVLFLSGITAQRLKKFMQKAFWRYGMAGLLMICALWTLHGTWQHAQHHTTGIQQGHDHHTMHH